MVLRNMDQQNVGIPQESQRTRKRKHSATAETAMKPSVAACVTNEQKRKSFKPNSQQKQQLEIKTQPLDFYTYGHPQFFHNANFTHDQRTGNGIAQIESHNFRAYHNYSSEMLPPSVPPAVNLALVGGASDSVLSTCHTSFCICQFLPFSYWGSGYKHVRLHCYKIQILHTDLHTKYKARYINISL